MTTPTPPTNVRIVLKNGSEVPVDCVYEGLVDDLYLWKVIAPREHWAGAASIKVEMLPAKTAITMGLEP